MSRCIAGVRVDADQRGFALLMLLGVIASAALAIVLVAQRFLPPLADREPTASANLATVQRAAALAHRRAGSFPANLDTLANATGLPTLGGWRRDPFGVAQDLSYRRTTASTTVRSRGSDRRLNTADDGVATLSTERSLRLRQRARLRLLRALVLRSQYRTQPSMSADERAAMRTAMYEIAVARRAWLTADTVARAALTTRRNDAWAVIQALTTRHGCPPLPTAMTGSRGLASRIGAADSMMFDGAGRRLVADPQLGMVAVGNDRRRGTDDDM
jgi:type II secretory pathway pseudopilin PulG